jgi:hypothetical protein
MRTLLTVGLLIALTTAAVAEDSIILKSGRILRGQILQTGETVVRIETATGREWVKRTEIESLVRAPAPKIEVAEIEVPRTRASETEKKKAPPVAREVPTPAPRPLPSAGPDRSANVEPAVRSSGARVGTPLAPDEDTGSTKLAGVLGDLGNEVRAVRAEAASWIVANWPASSRVVDSAQQCTVELARIEATRLLDHEQLGDTSRQLAIALRDRSARVRTCALRVVRHRAYPRFERQALDLMQNASEWVVRQEAIRTLETIATRDSLQPVFSAWSAEEDKDRKRRYRRVLRGLFGEDFGDDLDAWHAAIVDIGMGKRTVRGD